MQDCILKCLPTKSLSNSLSFVINVTEEIIKNVFWGMMRYYIVSIIYVLTKSN